jgi:hypothetical protein
MIATDPDCPDCFGTGYTGGYLRPVYLPALMNPPQKAIVAGGIPYEAGQSYMELANTPKIHPDSDVIVDVRNNIRYKAKLVTQFTHRMAVVSQIAQLIRVDENDVVYSIKVEQPPAAPEGRGWDLVTRDSPHALLRAARQDLSA